MDGAGERILIVDDERDFSDILFHVLKGEGFTPVVAHDGEAALEMIRIGVPDLVLLDVKMPGIDGMEVLRRSRRLSPSVPVLMITAYGGINGAVQAMREGASDYLSKPINNADLVDKIRRALQKKVAVAQRIKESASCSESAGAELRTVMGPSDAVKRVVAEAMLVAQSDFTVVIHGETGTGKELVTRAIHRAGPRRAEPLVPVDCGAIPETLFESEFFGYEKGAFTGAASARRGKFELAEGGALFLDEIGNMPLNSQIKLLRAIQEKSFFRVGGSKPVNVDVRLIVATNKDLVEGVNAGKFSRDLFYRLSEFTLFIPPLRERKEDILHLAGRFLKATNLELGKHVEDFSESAKDALLGYTWPGNARQLRSVVRRAVLQAEDMVRAEDLLMEDAPGAALDLTESERETPWDGSSLRDIVGRAVRETERRVIADVLNRAGGNKAKAARLLQVDYKTIHTKIKLYGIRPAGRDDD